MIPAFDCQLWAEEADASPRHSLARNRLSRSRLVGRTEVQVCYTQPNTQHGTTTSHSKSYPGFAAYRGGEGGEKEAGEPH